MLALIVRECGVLRGDLAPDTLQLKVLHGHQFSGQLASVLKAG